MPFAAWSFQELGPDARCCGVGGTIDHRAPLSISHRVESLESVAKRRWLPPFTSRGKAALTSPLYRFPKTFSRRNGNNWTRIAWSGYQTRCATSRVLDRSFWVSALAVWFADFRSFGVVRFLAASCGSHVGWNCPLIVCLRIGG